MTVPCAIILAAGRGSRLKPYTDDQPKCCIELDGRRLIDWQITTLRSVGIDDIVVVTGYRADKVTVAAQKVRNDDWANTNMVETLFCAEPKFGKDVVVAYADIVYELRLVRAVLDSPHDVSVVVDHGWRPYWESRFPDPLSDAETLRMDRDGCIVDIGRRPASFAEVEAQYVGLMRFRGEGVARLVAARRNLGSARKFRSGGANVRMAYMTDLLMHMIETGEKVHAVSVNGGWLEIDTAHDLEVARATVRNGTAERFRDRTAR